MARLGSITIELDARTPRRVTPLPPSWYGIEKCPRKINGLFGEPCGKLVTHAISWQGGCKRTSVCSRLVCESCAKDWAKRRGLEMSA